MATFTVTSCDYYLIRWLLGLLPNSIYCLYGCLRCASHHRFILLFSSISCQLNAFKCFVGGGCLILSLRFSDFLVIFSLIRSLPVLPAFESGWEHYLVGTSRQSFEASLNLDTFQLINSELIPTYIDSPGPPSTCQSHEPSVHDSNFISIPSTTFCLHPLATHITQWSDSGRIRGDTNILSNFPL